MAARASMTLNDGDVTERSERRRWPRIELLGRLNVQIVAVAVPIRVREISLGGLSFESAIPFPVDALHEFRLTLGDQAAVILRGRIVRSLPATGDDERFVIGVQFLDDEPPAGEPTIGDLIRQIK
jgi:hypothetical protein